MNRATIGRAAFLLVGLAGVVIATDMLMPWYEGQVRYGHPHLAFAGCIVLLVAGGFFTCLATVGWRGYRRVQAEVARRAADEQEGSVGSGAPRSR